MTDETEVIEVEPPFIYIAGLLEAEAAEAAEALAEVVGNEREARLAHLLRLHGMAYRAMSTSASMAMRTSWSRTAAGLTVTRTSPDLRVPFPTCAPECKWRDADQQRFSPKEIRKELDDARPFRDAAGVIFVTNSIATMPADRTIYPLDSTSVAVAFDPDGQGEALTAAYLLVRAAVVPGMQVISADDWSRQAAKLAIADIEANLPRLEEAEGANLNTIAQAQKSLDAIKEFRRVLNDNLRDLNHRLEPKT